MTLPKVRTLLSTLESRELVERSGSGDLYRATRRGREVAKQAIGKVSETLTLINDLPGASQSGELPE